MLTLLRPLLLKILGGVSLAMILALALMGWQLRRVMAERDALKEYKVRVVLVTREASDNPRLGADNVPDQIRYMGDAIKQVRAAQAQAKAEALAAKEAADRRNRERKDQSDDNLKAVLSDSRRRADNYARAHRVPRKRSPEIGDRRIEADMPRPAFGPGEPQGAGGEADMVAISRADFDTCTVNTERLENAVKWAAELEPVAPVSPQ